MCNRSTIKIITFILIGLKLSCAFIHSTQKKEERLRKEIIKGVTTETMALNLLGMPNSVQPNEIGDEVWYYKNLVYSATEIKDGKTLVLWEYTTGDSAEAPGIFHLLITFDQRDVMKNFEIINSPLSGNPTNQW